jgi:hypothetical protein
MRLTRLWIVAAVCLMCTLTLAADKQAKDADGAAKASLQNAVPEAAFDGVKLKDVVEFIADVAHVNFYYDRAAFESADINAEGAPVTTKPIVNGTVETVLKAVLANVGTKEKPATFAACGDVIVISTKDGAKDFTERHRKALARAAAPGADVLGKVLPELTLQAIALSDVIDFLRDISGANIFVDWKKLEAVGVTRQTPITVRAREVKVAQALQLVLDECWPTKAIGFELKDAVIEISTAPDAKDPPPHPERKPEAGKKGL